MYVLTGDVEVEHRIDMTYSQTMFFSNFADDIGVQNNIPHDTVKWYKEAGGICLKGRQSDVAKGKHCCGYWNLKSNV